jgi:hypothetical protein
MKGVRPVKTRRKQMSRCITCGEEKDSFSKENDYKECEPCSMIDIIRSSEEQLREDIH